MNNLFIVGSSIQTRNAPLTYSPVRTIFSSEERFRQTIFTVNSIQAAFPEAKIVVVDSSDIYKEYQDTFRFFKNTEFIPLKELDQEAFEIVNTHPNKSLCESLLLNTFYKKFRKEIKQYDYVIKTCGRYFYFHLNGALFDVGNLNKLFFRRR